LSSFLHVDKAAERIKHEIIDKSFFPNEIRIITELLEEIPHGSNLMVSNSLPIRDLDLAASQINKRINVFHNRGASGIEGIISTAMGIAKASNTKTFLLTGDLAFYYDMNSLLTAQKNSIPLVIILINNNGGRIFEALPIAKYKNVFEEYFATPHNLNFSKFIKGFGGNYFNVRSWANFRRIVKQTGTTNNFSVLEIRTNAKKSLALRKRYVDKVNSNYNQKFRD
jgi:2-succinyl-5-enolpyruvyl-6-hydroxy-3-cyclohexene-1-carboxylate synthase